MAEVAVPSPIPEDTTNVGGIVVDRDTMRSVLRILLVVVLATLLAGDIYLYSALQAEKARVESLTHRVDRLEKMVVDALTSNQNAVAVEELGQKVEGISAGIEEMHQTLSETKGAEGTDQPHE
jgi:hypothetical protein